MTRRIPGALLALALAAAGAACSGGSTPSGGAPTSGDDGPSDRFAVVGSPSPADLTAAAATVTARLARMGSSATVRVDGRGLRASAPVDAVLREAVGRTEPTALWSVTATTIGPCPAGGPGVPSLPEGRRCHTLGARLAGADAIASATPQLQPGLGWSVELFVQSAGFAALRDALVGAADRPVAVVAGGHVVGVFEATAAVGLHGRIAPGLSERAARRLAAALLVAEPSPVALAAPSFGPERGPLPDADFWLAALSAHVCGAWLPDAPATPDASGIHSHGDGFVYAHPYDASEAEGNATLGRWLGHGSWTATADRLSLWDGTPHRTGDPCPDGRPGVVRWWVDGVEQRGDPEKHRIGNGEAVTLSFNPEGVDPGPPPAAARLPLPRLTPEA